MYPSKAERKRVRDPIRKLQDQLTCILGNVVVVPVGSTAKETFTAGDHDIDLYIQIADKVKAYESVKKAFPNGQCKKGQLLIWNANVYGFDVDFVFQITKKREDTCKHTEYYNMHLTKQMKREVVRAKELFKGAGVYGAENGGIIGVAVEELARKYGTVENIAHELLREDLYLQDPTLTTERNFLASILPRRLEQLRAACRQFLTDGLVPKKKIEDLFEERYAGYHKILFERKKDRGSDFDQIFSQCEHAKRIVRTQEPEVGVDFDVLVTKQEIVVYYKATPEKLSPTREVCLDPSVLPQEAIQQFKAKHKTYVKAGLVCARKRRFTSPARAFNKTVLTRTGSYTRKT
jgi:tRNA nucleotidyltransferase (CCA-adding enzyme)